MSKKNKTMNLTDNSSSSSGERAASNNQLGLAIFIFVLILALVVGLIGNTLSTVVWFTQMKTKSAALFLGCLGFVDTFFCLAILISLIVIIAISATHISSCMDFMMKQAFWICAVLSRLLTITVVVQRWVAVCRPLSMMRLCTLQRRLIALTCLVLPFIADDIFLFCFICHCEANCSSSQFIERAKHIMTTNSWYNSVITMLCSVCTFVFSAMLLYSNCRIAAVNSSSTSSRWRRDMELRLTVIILCVSAVSMAEFLIVFTILLKAFRPGWNDMKDNIFGIYMSVLIFVRPINFVLYSCIGKEFRGKLKSMCKCKCSFSVAEPQREMPALTLDTSEN